MSEELQAFKVGINKPRSRGDREEVFGGLGASWKGAFVGGDLLVQAVTYGREGAARTALRELPQLLPPAPAVTHLRQPVAGSAPAGTIALCCAFTTSTSAFRSMERMPRPPSSPTSSATGRWS